MSGLHDREFAPSYDKSVDDIAELFYLPCMRAAQQYDRISGYFSSAIFSIAWPALKDFVKAGGRMRLICSPVFSSTDVGALHDGYAALTDAELGAALIAELRVLLDSARSRKPAQVLAGLIAAGVVDVRLAVLTDATGPGDRRLFHDKVGLFKSLGPASCGCCASTTSRASGGWATATVSPSSARCARPCARPGWTPWSTTAP